MMTITPESDATMRQRLFTSLSQSFPGSALSKALHFESDSDDSDSDDMKIDLKPQRLSSSCFAELRMERNNDNNNDESDDELTSLEWLQGNDILKNINDETQQNDQKENGNPVLLNNNNMVINPGQTHPSHIPYNPYKHVLSKPPYSFSCLIFMAVEDSPIKRLPVKDIYNWILMHFPYFQHAPTGWKNSVRHNLSLNKCFKKVDKDRGQAIGKGSLWCIDPEYRPHLLQALRKTPYHPYHQLQMLASPQISLQGFLPNRGAHPLSNFNNLTQISPNLFPFLSKKLSTGIDKTDIEIANTLVSLKSRSQSANSSPNSSYTRRLRQRLLAQKDPDYIIPTSFPSSDHTYSTSKSDERCDSPTSSIDGQYDFGSDVDVNNVSDDSSSNYSEFDEVDGEVTGASVTDGRKRKLSSIRHKNEMRNKRRRRCKEEEENKKIADGANALLNLAGITNTHIISLRSISPDSGRNETVCSSNTTDVGVSTGSQELSQVSSAASEGIGGDSDGGNVEESAEVVNDDEIVSGKMDESSIEKIENLNNCVDDVGVVLDDNDDKNDDDSVDKIGDENIEMTEVVERCIDVNTDMNCNEVSQIVDFNVKDNVC